jgi:zinc-binding alcohol dehydrogenase/oxidoreductase
MGSPSDFSSMLHFVQKHRIKPVIDAVYPMSEYKKAFKRLAESEQFGKIVFDNEK